MTAIKIAVTGTHSTGKTTFVTAVCSALEERGARVAVVSDLGEEAMNLGFPILYNHVPESDPDGRFRAMAAQGIGDVLSELGLSGEPLTPQNQEAAAHRVVEFVASRRSAVPLQATRS